MHAAMAGNSRASVNAAAYAGANGGVPPLGFSAARQGSEQAPLLGRRGSSLPPVAEVRSCACDGGDDGPADANATRQSRHHLCLLCCFGSERTCTACHARQVS